MTDCIKHVALPQICGACINRALANATANPEQKNVSIFCEHGASLITGQLATRGGERVLHAWNVTGPLSPEQARAGIRQAAAAAGLEVVDTVQTIN